MKIIIIGAVSLIAVIFAFFAAINKKGELADEAANRRPEIKAPEHGFNRLARVNDFVKTNFSPQPEDPVSSNIPADSQGGAIPRIADFFQTGTMEAIRDLSREDIRLAIEAYVSMQSSDQLAETLHRYLGMPYGLFDSIDKPADYLMEVADLVREEVKQSPPLSNLIITDACAEDGSVAGAVHTIPAGASRIFAVFENSDDLQGIDDIYAVWRDLNDDSMTFSEYEPLRRDSTYNYVWLEFKGGWSAGIYKLDLADSASPSSILASTKFRVE